MRADFPSRSSKPLQRSQINLPQPQQPPYYEYDDYYNFATFEGSSQTYEGSHDWFGPGPEKKIRPSKAHTGNPRDVNARISSVTLIFNGTKNAQDQLSFIALGGSCVEQLGPVACSDFWQWNLEASVIVNDDASKWTVKQIILSSSTSGYTKDGNGTLHPFSGQETPGDDGPDFYNTLLGRKLSFG